MIFYQFRISESIIRSYETFTNVTYYDLLVKLNCFKYFKIIILPFNFMKSFTKYGIVHFTVWFHTFVKITCMIIAITFWTFKKVLISPNLPVYLTPSKLNFVFEVEHEGFRIECFVHFTSSWIRFFTLYEICLFYSHRCVKLTTVNTSNKEVLVIFIDLLHEVFIVSIFKLRK